MKKPILSFLLIVISHCLFAQSFYGVSANPVDNGTVAASTVVVAPPTPASMVAGDLVVVYAHYKVAAVTLAITAANAAGQTWLTETTANGGNQTFAIFWCRYNGTWAGSPTVSVTAGAVAGTPLTAVMYVYRPSASTSTWAIHMPAVNTSGTGTAANIAAGPNTTVAKTVSMAFWCSPGLSAWTSPLGGGWLQTGISASYRNLGGTDQSHAAAYNIKTTTPGALAAINQNQSVNTTWRASLITWLELPNDNCAQASLISSDSICLTGTSRLINQTLQGATVQGGGLASSCGTATSPDVWYKFVARSQFPTVTVSNLGTNWGTSLRVQLFKGNCGALTEIACASNAALTPSPAAVNQVVIGDTCFVRVHRNTAAALATTPNWGFDICITDPLTKGGRMREIFSRTVLSAPTILNYPWEVTYGRDNNLWVTESKGYKVYRINPNTGARVMVLDIANGSNFLGTTAYNCTFANGSGAQGGLAGLALHPNFRDGTAQEKNFVYVSYIKSQQAPAYFTNSLVRFTYNAGTDRFESPVVICDTLPGSNDHNSQRVIVAPVVKGGSSYLFYASGDMGAGQGSVENIQNRPIRSQLPNSYEGKILRFNLDTTGAADANDATTGDKWIPDDNQYSALPVVGKQSAVWNIGQRNNQGFAYDTARNILWGASHGAYSDDEINILLPFRNYGHPLIVGYTDGNYDGNTNPGTAGNNLNISAGAPYMSGNTTFGNSTCPPIGSESNRKTQIDGMGYGLYKEPTFSGYPGPMPVTAPGSVRSIWQTTNGSNGSWPSEGWSGLDLYTNKVIPGWKNSLVAAGLKWGRLLRFKLNATGDTVVATGTGDTITYFQSTNRYRDLAFAPNGKDIYVIMDNSSSTSGPGTNNPVTPACMGCLIKYSFLGYADEGGKSTISPFVPVAAGDSNVVNQGTPVTIDGTNNRLWVPITGTDGNIVAEINAMGQNLGLITSSYYTYTDLTRNRNGFRYMDRNITITPAVTSFSTPVKVRLYFSKVEFDSLDADPASGITGGIGQLKILKNDDPASPTILASTTEVPVTNALADRTHGTSGYVLQTEVTSFSSFYFGATNITLPLELVYFKGSLQNNSTQLQWETVNENNTSHFEVERSTDGRSFEGIGSETAQGNASNKYSYVDLNVNDLASNVLYYRLKMIDKDGKFNYSNVVTIYLTESKNTLVLTPNPTNGRTNLQINAAIEGKIEWKLLDNNGRVVMQNVANLRTGQNNIPINATHLNSGVYYIQVTGAGIDQKLKLQKL